MLPLLAWLLLGQPSHPLCAEADRFLRGDRQLTTVVEADTLNDWRTKQTLIGCRITAAGGSTRGLQAEAVFFYERLRAIGGWARTPDPRDAPNEGSLRFRTGSGARAADCLFNVYGEAMLMTEAELRVDEQRPLQAAETRYHVYVMCLPAPPAASERGGRAEQLLTHPGDRVVVVHRVVQQPLHVAIRFP